MKLLIEVIGNIHIKIHVYLLVLQTPEEGRVVVSQYQWLYGFIFGHTGTGRRKGRAKDCFVILIVGRHRNGEHGGLQLVQCQPCIALE